MYICVSTVRQQQQKQQRRQWHDQCDGNGNGGGGGDGGGCQTKSAMSMIKCKRDEFINQLSRVSERYGNVTICESESPIQFSIHLHCFGFCSCVLRVSHNFFSLRFHYVALLCVCCGNVDGIHSTFVVCVSAGAPVVNVFSMNTF